MDDWLSVSLGDLNLTPIGAPEGLGLSTDMGSSSSKLGLSRSVGVWPSLTPVEHDLWWSRNLVMSIFSDEGDRDRHCSISPRTLVCIIDFLYNT